MLANSFKKVGLATIRNNKFYLSNTLASQKQFIQKFNMTTGGSTKVLHEGNINKNVRNVEYAVRGALAIRSEELREALERGEKLPFKSVVGCNIGNPQQVGQKPITFFRQVAALTEVPELLEGENLAKTEALFPKDVIARAREIISHVKTVGAYSHSQGVPYIRQRVAKFIEERDGFSADPNHIFLTSGASAGVQLGLQLLIENSNVGVMIPIPQYPLYTASLALFDGKPVPYYLDESNDWGLNVDDLRASLKKSRDEGVDVRSLVIINPGNPTGQCLTFDNMKEIVQFCKEEKLILMADEVYQVNIYQPEARPFHSFKKVVRSLGPEYDGFELISFHSISKGMIGECGRRGGYFELCGFDPKVIAQIYKIASVSLCPNVPGQIMVDLMLHPPTKGDESYDLYHSELNGIYESLKRRALKLCAAFNSLEGVTCNEAQGAMYLFPQITLPAGAVEAAKAQGTQPDELYCMELLNATGVCLVPGSGFGQKDGTYHFRSTFLPPENLFDDFIGGIKQFHENFLAKYN